MTDRALKKLQKFIENNASELFLKVISDSNKGIQSSLPKEFNPVLFKNTQNFLSIENVQFAGNSKDYLTNYEDPTYIGYVVTNLHMSFILAIKK